MRVSSVIGSRAAFGLLVGLALAMPVAPARAAQVNEATAAAEETVAPTEPVAIEIIGETVEAPADGTDGTTTDTPAKDAEAAPSDQLSPVLDQPLAATASIEPQEAAGIEVPENWGTVDPFVGSFSTAVTIDVPGFHGIAPNLALTYNSSRGNGFAGLGWELSGASVIERSGPNTGAPRYDAGDVFMLDGQELIACEAGTVSPSCGTGGTHATEIESYRRIVHDATANTWTVTHADGTARTYAAKLGHNLAASAGTYRWAMVSVADTHGNTVGYAWWCDGQNDCYLDTATYNGVTVTIHREPRTDPIVGSKGNGLLRTDYRLKTVEVRVGTDVLRAYALTYAASEATGQSRLTGVTRYGRDAVLDPMTGVVTAGTALPATSFTWPEEANGTFATANWGQPCQTPRGMGDFNGDGKDDVYCETYSPGYGDSYGIALSNGDGTYADVNIATTPWCTRSSHSRSSVVSRIYRFADFNGDGLDDVQCTRTIKRRDREGSISYTVDRSIALSNGDGTLSGTSTNNGTWCVSFPLIWNFTPYDGVTLGGDFNGDGKADQFCREFERRESNNGDMKTFSVGRIGLSVGDGTFTNINLWTLCNGFEGEVLIGDFNGDGRSDIYSVCGGSGTVSLSNGNGTFRAGRTLSFCGGGARGVADFNGDGRDDLYCQGGGSDRPNGTVSIATSMGDGGFVQTTTGASVCGPNSAQSGWTMTPADMNGDGMPDISCRKNIENVAALNNGNGGFATGSQWNWCGTNQTTTDEVRTADIDGDGKRDLYCLYANSLEVAVSSGSQPGLLTSASGPLGGTTTVGYTPSSEWSNGFLPMTVQTVSAITSDDGRGNTSTTNYAYEGGLWHHGERRFLGFRKATTTLPCIAGETVCPYTESTFRQDLASAGRVEQVDRFDGAGTLLTRALEEYVVNDTTAPYTALNTASESHIVVGAVTRRTRVTRVFDAYANVVEETGHGDADILGDEITAATDYAPNTTGYITTLPARMRSFEGVGTSGTLLTEGQILYDNAADWTTPPVRGDPTETRTWLDTEARFVASQAEYDTFGNVIATIDPLGRRAETDYDPVYHLYPVASRNPLYFPPSSDIRHRTGTQWDTVCGVPTVTTDLNGNDTTTQYDALCRPTRTDLPGGGFAITGYNNLGDPTAQYVETQTPPADGSGNIWSRVYMDGFGRPYRSTAKGPAAGRDIAADTAYDDRGNVASQTAPYYTGDPVHTTTLDYDALDRPTAVTHPDGNWTETAYGVEGAFVSTTGHDELGHPVTLHLDAFGRMVRREEPLDAATTVTTDYAHDRLGRLTGITDDAGNDWAYTFDSFGRTLTVDDPDLGLWTKSYDDAGQLLTQTDALAQVTRFTYDALGRMLTKTARDGTAQAELTSYTYDEHVAGYHNMGLLTRQTNAVGELRHRYNKAGLETRRVWEIDGAAYRINSHYDDGGRLIRQGYPDGDKVGTAADPITYDGAGRLLAVPGLIASTTYDAGGNAETLTRANGVVSTYGYSNQRGWLDSLTTLSGATSIQALSYTRDAAGQITAVASTRADESWTYGYDALRRLLSATNTDTPAHSRTYTYDSIGNMLSNSGIAGSYSYPLPTSPRPHAVTAIGGWTYSYDANGNMTAGAGRTFTHNGDNRPTQIDTQTYSYGPDGERWKTVDSSPGGATTLYLGGSIEIAADVMTKYLPGDAKRVGSPSDPLVETFWLHRDHQGSIQAITDATGAEVQRFLYEPYGDRIATTTAHDESKGWIGERQDATGLFYLHARYYDPVIGRFNSADPSDPLAPGVGLNRYAYADNSPVMRIDPWGLWSTDDYSANGESDTGADGRYGSSIGGTDRDTSSGPWTQIKDRSGNVILHGNQSGPLSKQIGFNTLKELAKSLQGTGCGCNLDGDAIEILRHMPIWDGLIKSYEDFRLFSAYIGAVLSGQPPQPETGLGPHGVILIGTSIYNPNGITYITYAATNPTTQKVYSGQASGVGTPQQILEQRWRNHHMSALGFGNPQINVAAQSPSGVGLTRLAITGREQQMIDLFGGAISDGGISGNPNRAYDRNSDAGIVMHNLSNIYFGGQLHRYTGNL